MHLRHLLRIRHSLAGHCLLKAIYQAGDALLSSGYQMSYCETVEGQVTLLLQVLLLYETHLGKCT